MDILWGGGDRCTSIYLTRFAYCSIAWRCRAGGVQAATGSYVKSLICVYSPSTVFFLRLPCDRGCEDIERRLPVALSCADNYKPL